MTPKLSDAMHDADFVVIDGDPLTHIEDTLKIIAVVKGGVWHERSALIATP